MALFKNKRLWWGITGGALVIGGMILFSPLRQWYYNNHADSLITNAFADRGLGRMPRSDTELTVDQWAKLLTDEIAAVGEADVISSRLGPDAAPALVRLLLDKSAGDFARSQAASPLLAMPETTWIVRPTVDYDGLILLALTVDEHPLHREAAIDLLGLWKHRSAATQIRVLLEDASLPKEVRDAAIRNITRLDSSISGLPAQIFDTGLPLKERLNWFAYVDNLKLSKNDLERLRPLVLTPDLAISNRAIRAIGRSGDSAALTALSNILESVVIDNIPFEGSISLLTESLLVAGEASARATALDQIIRAGVDRRQWAKLDEILSAIRDKNHPGYPKWKNEVETVRLKESGEE